MHRFLKSQLNAAAINEELNKELSQAPCETIKQPGIIYYYYKIKSNGKFLTIMSPKEMDQEAFNYEYLGGNTLFFTSGIA